MVPRVFDCLRQGAAAEGQGRCAGGVPGIVESGRRYTARGRDLRKGSPARISARLRPTVPPRSGPTAILLLQCVWLRATGAFRRLHGRG